MGWGDWIALCFDAILYDRLGWDGVWIGMGLDWIGRVGMEKDSDGVVSKRCDAM